MAETSVFVIEDDDLFEEKITRTDRPFPNWDKVSPKTFYADGVRFNDSAISAFAPCQYAELFSMSHSGGGCYVHA